MHSQTEIVHPTTFDFSATEKVNYGTIKPYYEDHHDRRDQRDSPEEAQQGMCNVFFEDYLKYLELNVEAVSWYLISDEEQLKFYTRWERFSVGFYTFVVNLAVGTCIRSLNTCESEGDDHSSNSGLLDALIWSASFSMISSLYEFVFLVPLFRYILKRDTDDSGIFQKIGCSGKFCNCFIYVPIGFLALTALGFMTGDQGSPPECRQHKSSFVQGNAALKKEMSTMPE
eukprot:144101-Hanusia_phi.AAC.2